MYDRGRSALLEPLSSVKVEAYPGEPIESLLRRFKKVVQKALVISDYRRHEYFVAPSLRRRVKSHNARARRRT